MNIKSFLKKIFIPEGMFSNTLSRLFVDSPHQRSDLQQAYNYFVGWAGIAINRRAEGVAKFQIYATQKNVSKKNNVEIIEKKILPQNHWVNQLIYNPNPTIKMTYSELIKLIVLWLDYTGNAYIYMNTNGLKFPVQLILLPSNQININYNTSSLYHTINYYSFNGLQINPENIIHFRTLAPSGNSQSSFNLGEPIRLKAALDSMEVDKATKEYMKRQFYNDFIEPIYIASKGLIQQSYLSDLKNTIKNNTVSHKIITALQEGMEFKNLPTSSQGQELIKSEFAKDKNAEMVAAAFGIPYGIMVTSSQQNKSNAAEQYANFRNDTLEPLANQICESLTLGLSQFEKDLELTFDKFEYKDPQFEFEQDKFFLLNGIKSRNEIRQEYGLPPLKNGDDLFIPTNIILESDYFINQEINNNPNEKKKFFGIDYDNMPNILKYMKWKSIDNNLKNTRKKLKSTTIDIFNDIQKEVLKNIVKKFNKNFNKVLKIDVLFDKQKFIDKMKNLFTSEQIELIKKIFLQAEAEFEGKIPKSDFENLISEISKETSDKISDSINTIDNDLKKTIQNIIKENSLVSNEVLLGLIIDKTNEKFSKVYTKSRAQNIAITTTTYTQGVAQIKACNSLDLNYIWLSQRDGKVRASHRLADGKSPDSEGYFAIGTDKMKSPAGGTQAKENCHCRCYIFARKKN